MSARKSNTQRLHSNMNYGLYCVHMFGSGLNTIKEEFKRQVQTGLRQSLFIVDLADIEQELDNLPRNSKLKKDLKKNYNNILINIILQKVQHFRKQYDLTNQKIKEELKFDLYQYWLDNPGTYLNKSREISDQKSNKNSKDSKDTKIANGVKVKIDKEDEIDFTSSLITKEYNKVGQSEKLSKRKYIKDEPTLGKLFIIILGQMSVDFYMDLLRHDQPLEGIINFMPSESNYDIMLGNNKIRNFIEETLKEINLTNFELRQLKALKSVGLFTHNLPVISICMAKKLSQEIYDQLSWSIYDIEILKQQYDQYYFKPFQLTNVEIPSNENLKELYYKVDSLSVKGDFQDTEITANVSDLAFIASYLNSLMRACEITQENFRETILRDSNFGHHYVNNHKKLFESITKICRYNRLIVADNNKLLLNMLENCDGYQGKDIYLCCLDYNILKEFSINFGNSVKNNTKNVKKLCLPQYVKYYANKDCSRQRLMELQQQHEDFKVQEIANNCNLYTFKRFYNIVQEHEGSIIIPTRLCFRDFTLFQMQEFLENLKYPKTNSDLNYKETLNTLKVKTLELEENIFIRPNSLKALKLKRERNSIEYTKRKSESHSSHSKNEKKSSLSKSFNRDQDYFGLPPNHNLLKGYNLADTLQEIKYKTSKYHYPLGFINLYEECWCFQEINKQLSWSILDTTIFFNKPRYKIEGLSNNIRLLTKNNINLRILNESKECSKIIMNYPNGLTIFHHDSYCEQIWQPEHTLRGEKRRIYTPYGAVIVYFRTNDFILIMRYNGEVYKLFQHELLEEEEEQEFINNFADIQEKSSGYINHKSQDGKTFLKRDTKKIKRNSYPKTEKSKHSKTTLSEESIKISSKSTSIINNLKSSVNNELNFLNFLSSIYELKYLHVMITTSQGKRIKLTHQGEIFESRTCSIQEWHDYFANESYCERSDGVKMIWSKTSFKCFHEDGTIFKTINEEKISAQEEEEDEFESKISQSSSHNEFKEEMEEEKTKTLFENREFNHGKSEIYTTNNSTFIFTEAAEEFETPDHPIVNYVSHSWFMQHPSYAHVYILNTNFSHMPVSMEIFGMDNIRIYCHKEQSNETDPNNLVNMESEDGETELTSSNFKTIVNVWIGEDLNMRCDEESCEIFAVISQNTIKENEKRESLKLSLKYTDDINDIFKYLIKQIASLECNKDKNQKILYFMEKINEDNTIRGFEFYNKLPLLMQNNSHNTNNIIELSPLQTLNEKMKNDNVMFKQDLQKFPRFRTCNRGQIYDREPLILSANIFLEIPKQLRNTANITKFLEPFENISFKKLRNRFKNVLNSQLKPQQSIIMKTYSSSKNWKKRQWEHERRVFNEQQRLGLYLGMYKFKIFPDYWKFTKTYKGEVRNIEFFDFMQNKCKSK